MGSDWTSSTLGNVCETITDGAHHSPKSVIDGLPMASVKDMSHFGIVVDTTRRISESDFNKLVKQGCKPKIGDVLIAKDGNSALDTVCTVRHEADYVLLSSVAILRPKQSNLDSDFLKYYFCSPSTLFYLKSNFISGAAIPRVILKDFKKAEILLPPLPEQERIAHILGSLDDKIELNRQMNQTLEAMAQALFKSWFVDFDPVIDNALKAGNPIPEPLQKRAAIRQDLHNSGQAKPLPQHIQSLFPNRFALTDEMGWVPEGWEVTGLPNVIDFLEGPGIRNWQYTNDETGIKFINIRCIKDGDLFLDTANRITEKEAFGKYKHFQLKEDDLVISTSGTLGRIAFVRSEHLPLSLNTSVIRFRPIKDKSTLYYIAGYASTRLQWELETRASGSVQNNFGPMHLKQIEMLLPSISVLTQHQELAAELFSKRKSNLKNIDALLKLRDTLLPKLISGGLRIPEAEEQVKEAVG